MQKKQILIVEDERIVAEDISRSLAKFGYSVCGIVVTGDEAIKIAEEKSPDLILMDIMLKGQMNGIDVARYTREKLNIPIIFVTAYADEKTLNQAKVTEPFGYIIKPFDDAELHTTIQMAFYRHEMECKLKETKDRLATILKSISDAVIVTDKESKVTYMNPTAETLTGWNTEEALGTKLSKIYNIIDDKDADESELISDFLKNKVFLNRTNQLLVAKNKDIIPIDTVLTNLIDSKNVVAGKVVVIRDITNRIQAEQKMRETMVRLRKAIGGVIQAMAFTVETRDPYTAGHQRRVANLARAIATEMKLDSHTIDGIRLAGVIHDIGKVAVPSEILSKPGVISDIEFKLIQSHCKVGYDILKNIEFPWPIAQIVLQHHERLDGSGYPNALTEKDIILEAKIVAIADVVEAMASHRPYRPSLGLEKALNEIKENMGKKYDTKAAKACIDLFQKKNFVF